MRVELRSQAPPVCEYCGSHELIHTKTGQALSFDLLAAIDKWFEGYRRPRKWWQRRARLDERALVADIQAILAEMHYLTRKV